MEDELNQKIVDSLKKTLEVYKEMCRIHLETAMKDRSAESDEVFYKLLQNIHRIDCDIAHWEYQMT
jgi:hypothetical protein